MPYTHVNPYCSLASLREELKMKAGDTSRDDVLKEYIDLASRWIDEYTGRSFFERDFTVSGFEIDDYDDAVFKEVVFLPYRPIISITALSVGGTALVAGTEFVAKTGKLISLKGDWLISRPDSVMLVKGTFGYPQRTSGTLDPTIVPAGLPGHVTLSARMIAAALSGYDRHEVVGFDGMKQDFVNRSIPKSVFQILGKRRDVIV